MSYLLRTFDCAMMYNLCMGVWPYTFMALPILNVIARYGSNGETGQLDSYITATLWIGIAMVLALARIGGVAYT